MASIILLYGFRTEILHLAWCWKVEDSQGIDLLLSYSRQRWAKAAGVVCISQ